MEAIAEITAAVKNVPGLRFPEFEGALISTKFGKVVESTLYGPRFNAEDYSEYGNVKTIRGTDLGRDGEIKYHQVPLAKLDEKTVSTHKLEDGDIVIITTADCGATGVFRKKDIDYISSAYGVRVRLNELGYPYYFKYFFQTRLSKKEINSFIRKATVANLPGSDISKIKIFLPTLLEQQKVASFLTIVDDKIQQLSQKKELLEKYKKGVMQQIFTQQIRFKDDNGNNFPDWEEMELKKVANINPKNKNLPNSFVYVDLESVEKGNLTKENTIVAAGAPSRAQRLLTKCDVLFQMVRPYQKNNLYFNMEGDYVASTGYAQIRSKSDSDALYLFQYIHTDKFVNRVLDRCTGTSYPAINSSDLASITIDVPVKQEQQKIGSFLTSIDNKINYTSKQLEQAHQYKKGLLQQLFV